MPRYEGSRAVAAIGALLFAVSLAVFGWVYLDALATRPIRLTPPEAIGVNLLLFVAFGAHHSVLARPRVRAFAARLVGPRLERSLYVWVASVLFLAVMLLWQPFDGALWRTSGPAAIGLRGLQIAGIVFTIVAARVLDPFSLAGLRQIDAPLPPDGLERATGPLKATGPYGLVRHPIYLAWLLIVWPAPVMTAAHALFATLSTAYLVIAIPLEERTLHRVFGGAYADYVRRVRWRMLPGVY